MKRLFKRLISFSCIFGMSLILVGCSSTKPDDGYVPVETIVENVINNIDASVTYSSFNSKYALNYFGKESPYLPAKGENTKVNIEFTDSPQKYTKACSSLFLNLPLHITSTNWTVKKEDGSVDTISSTKQALESRLYQAGSEYDFQLYYYEREGGGFIVKAFGTNKGLKINQLYENFVLQCTGKWNITVEYDKDGFLVMEKFETINSHKEDDSKSCYGYATYTYNH